jgi:predicted molibdopterin-dependent oxidoreductase YjgC
VEHELTSAEFLVVQDIFPNQTTRFVHVILPAAAWSENDGTFTNSERRNLMAMSKKAKARNRTIQAGFIFCVVSGWGRGD